MSVADTKTQPKQVNQGVVYDLNVLSGVSVPNLGLQLASISTSVGPILNQVAGIAAAMEAIVKPMQEAMKAFHEMVQRIIEPVKEMMKAYATTFKFLTTFKPVYYVPAPPVATELPARADPYLPVTQDQYGFFVIDGEPIKVLHPASSRIGKILRHLLRHKSKVVTYKELRELVGPNGDLRGDIRVMRYQLRQLGYDVDDTVVRAHGIALNGLTKLQ